MRRIWKRIKTKEQGRTNTQKANLRVSFKFVRKREFFHSFKGKIDENNGTESKTENNDSVYSLPYGEGYANPYNDPKLAPTPPSVSKSEFVTKKWWIIFIVLLSFSIGGIVVGLSVHFTKDKTTTSTTTSTTPATIITTTSSTKTTFTMTETTTALTTFTTKDPRNTAAVLLISTLDENSQAETGLKNVQMVIGLNGQFYFIRVHNKVNFR